MTLPYSRRWMTLTLVAIIIPISLLTTLKMTGILQEPLVPEVITVEPVTWNMTRPDPQRPAVIDVIQWVNTSYNEATYGTLNLSVLVEDYTENELDWPAYGNDYVQLKIVLTADLNSGYIYSVAVKFSKTDETSLFHVNDASTALKAENLSVIIFRGNANEYNEAYVEFSSIDGHKSCFLSMVAYWIFTDEHTQGHGFELTAETIICNGTAYQKVVQPIILKVLVP